MPKYSWNNAPRSTGTSTSSRHTTPIPPLYTPPSSSPPEKGDGDGWFWIICTFFFLIHLWPLSLVMLISKFSDRKKAKKRPVATQQPIVQHTQVERTIKHAVKTPVYSEKKTKILLIFGIILASLGGVSLLSALVENLPFLFRDPLYVFKELFSSLGFFLTGGGLIFGSRAMKQRARRFGKYLVAAHGQEAIDINDLAMAADVTEPRAEKDVELMVEKGLWGERAYVDAGRDMLFLSPAAAQRYFAAQEKPISVPKEANKGYSGVLRNIRRANDRIADPVLSEKISRVEDLAGKILRLIEQQPAKKTKAATFLNYYLPTTQKLLDSYADFEEAGVRGKNLDDAKAKIRSTMNNIVVGFARQLDELYQDEALDIDSDIRVMENMLRRDGASVETDFDLYGSTAVQAEDAEFE